MSIPLQITPDSNVRFCGVKNHYVRFNGRISEIVAE